MTDDTKRRLIILAVVVVAALLFLWPTLNLVGKNLAGKVVTAEERLGGNWISRPISLGLDLSGGVHLLYRVMTAEAIVSRLQSNATAIRSDLRRGKVAVTRTQVVNGNELEITLFSARHAPTARQLIEEEYRSLLFQGESTDEQGRTRLRYRMRESDEQLVEISAVSQAVETLRSRVDQFGVAEPLIQKVGVDRILLQMPGVDDIEAVKKIVGRVAKLEFRFLPRPGESEVGTVMMRSRESGVPIPVEDEVKMTGDMVDTARVGSDEFGKREIALTLTPEGGRLFARITTEGVGRQLAIILDNEVYSSPVIQEPIRGGRCSITGSFTLQEAQELAVVLRAGALPAPLEVMEERTVGPTLGQESIRKGLTAIALSFLLVITFMAIYYRKAGWIAVGSLGLNVVLVLALLSAFGATLTLPGLAGLALTVGMAVDSNVIIFERIREELKNGSSRDAAVDGGFSKAFSAIIDANITTLLASLILYYFGTGPIRGFAVTLSIGILTTIFCATFVARLAFQVLPVRNKEGLSI